jgi:hypothetical protein
MVRKPYVAIAVAAAWFASAPVSADDHLVTRGTLGSRLSDAASERARNLSSLDGLLASPRAARVAGKAGVDIDQVRGALPHLSDGELRDLSHRATALGNDPVAGDDYDDMADLVVLLVVVAVAAAVVVAVAHSA